MSLKCFYCKNEIPLSLGHYGAEDDYVYLAGLKNRKILHFHVKCLGEAAGKEYIEAMGEPIAGDGYKSQAYLLPIECTPNHNWEPWASGTAHCTKCDEVFEK